MQQLHYADIEIMAVQSAFNENVINRHEAIGDLMKLGLDYFEAGQLVDDWDD